MNKDGKIEGHKFGLRKGEGNFLLLTHTAMPIQMGEKCKEKGENGEKMKGE